MDKKDTVFDCQRGCQTNIETNGQISYCYNQGCCKRSVFDWLGGIPQEEMENLFEVRFKNTRKGIYQNTSGQVIRQGDIVVVEAQNGCDVGIVTLSGAIVGHQLRRNSIDYRSYEFKRIYRKARPMDIQKWQEAIAREHQTMIRARVLAANLGLEMKIGDVEFQGDGTKAIFYYIADGRVDFRQLIKDFAEEFHIRIEMKQIGARQEAGLIGGLGVCGQPLCCSRYINNFQSITTAAARSQDLSLNPQKLAGQCGKLKCCINYEAAVYLDAKENIPVLGGPLHLEDGDVVHIKSDALKQIMWFRYADKDSDEAYPLEVNKVKEILEQNGKGMAAPSIAGNKKEKVIDFKSAAGEDSITRFDEVRKKKNGKQRGKQRFNRRSDGSRSNQGQK